VLKTKVVEAGFDLARHHALALLEASVEDVEAACLTTVGLSNGERVGSRRSVRAAAGTINTLVRLSRSLPDGALVEAISMIVAEARTAAILETRRWEDGPPYFGHRNVLHRCRLAVRGRAASCAGLHTAVGEAIGGAVYRSTRAGAEEWDAENAHSH
jgi:adenosylcobinamide amidohydrolase